MYVRMAEEADAEGFPAIAHKFRMVAAIEKAHEERYRRLLANVENDLVFSKDGDVIWECANCGHIVVGKKAPEICPVCAHPQSYFMVKAEKLLILLISDSKHPSFGKSPKEGCISFVDLWEQHAHTVCRCAHLNREKGVERVEDPSQVQGRALLGSRGKAPWVSPVLYFCSGIRTALMRRTPAEEDSSFWILNVPRSPVFCAWGPPQISKE